MSTEREKFAAIRAERDALKAEVERLKAGGCARNQRTTQFCAEAVAVQAERDHWKADYEAAAIRSREWQEKATKRSAERDALKARVEELEKALEEREAQRLIPLLCRIHRDGGHYVHAHGLDKACEDADKIIAQLNADRDCDRSKISKVISDWLNEYGVDAKSEDLNWKDLEERLTDCFAQSLPLHDKSSPTLARILNQKTSQ